MVSKVLNPGKGGRPGKVKVEHSSSGGRFLTEVKVEEAINGVCPATGRVAATGEDIEPVARYAPFARTKQKLSVGKR